MTGRALFFSPDTNIPVGGIRKIYEYADALRRGGYDAQVVHERRGFKGVDWFEHDVPVVHRKDITPRPDDVLVIPEVWGKCIPRIAPGLLKVVLSQNIYLAADEHFTHEEVAAIVVVAEHSRRFSATAYPGKRIERIHNGIDPAEFYPRPKTKSVAFMPRKRRKQTELVLGALERRGALAGWTVTPIDAVSASETAKVLGEAHVFLSFSEREGFALPPLEAMASGCLVIGYDGQVGAECFQDRWCFPVQDDDMLGFVETAEQVLQRFDVERDRFESMQEAAVAMVRAEYTPKRQDADVVRIFGSTLAAAAERPVTPPAQFERARIPPKAGPIVMRHLKDAAWIAMRR